jgi:hypothetical protein
MNTITLLYPFARGKIDYVLDGILNDIRHLGMMIVYCKGYARDNKRKR